MHRYFSYEKEKGNSNIGNIAKSCLLSGGRCKLFRPIFGGIVVPPVFIILIIFCETGFLVVSCKKCFNVTCIS